MTTICVITNKALVLSEVEVLVLSGVEAGQSFFDFFLIYFVSWRLCVMHNQKQKQSLRAQRSNLSQFRQQFSNYKLISEKCLKCRTSARFGEVLLFTKLLH
jgi:hypothetical protein